MAKYKIKNSGETVEIISFEELVIHGFENGANIVNEMPWSWNYKGHAITHENDECYLIPNKLHPTEHQRMTPGHMLVTTDDGQIYVVDKQDYISTYELLE